MAKEKTTCSMKRKFFTTPSMAQHPYNTMAENNKISVAELAEMVKGQLLGDGTVLIRGFAPLEAAGPKEITFLAKAKMADC